MNYLSEMEWSLKRDWESFGMFCPKAATESLKEQQLADWMIAGYGEINTGPFNLSVVRGNSDASASEEGYGSSARSSISDTSLKDGMTIPDFNFGAFEGSSLSFGPKLELNGTDGCGNSPLETSVVSVEPLIGFKLGKRADFENGGVRSIVPISVMPTPRIATTKKTKSSGSNLAVPRCQVEGCDCDLSMAKEYHRKHKICESHSKCPKVIVAGVERRFCQQCSRFHSLSEFDEKKRSCRKRLSDHNARRRKPRQETMRFNSTRLSSPFYGGREEMNFLLNSAPVRADAKSIWDTTHSSKFTITKGSPLKSSRTGCIDWKSHLPVKLTDAINISGNETNDLPSSKGSTSEVFNPGLKGSMIPSHLDAAPAYSRALSLLSSNSWGSIGPGSTPVHGNGTNMTPLTMHPVPEGILLTSSEFWLTGQHSTYFHAQPSAATSNFEEIQLFKAPHAADFYSNVN